MKSKTRSQQATIPSHLIKKLCIAALPVALSGCYVEVSQPHVAYTDTEVNYYYDITDMYTKLLVDAALVPIALGMKSPNMIIDPDAYTEPRTRDLSRALVVETSYTYLFENRNCSNGGYTQIDAQADTAAYNDGFKYVDIQLSSDSYNCTVLNQGVYHTINSRLNYDVYGWYDQWKHKISSVDGRLEGDVRVEYSNQLIDHVNIVLDINNLSSTDFLIQASSSLALDSGLDYEVANYSTSKLVHWIQNSSHPHQGKIMLRDGYDWVTLTFESGGLWREDSAYHRSYWTWSELGYY